MWIRFCITILLSLPALWLAVRYNMHMLQLNGYKNKEQRAWLKKNLRKQWILFLSLFLGIARIVLPVMALDIACWITLWLVFLVFRAHKNLNTKKKFVITARVKRMFFTIILIWVAAIIGAFIFGGANVVSGALMVLVASSICIGMISNIINHPVELAINQYYINDASNKLKGVSGIRIIGVTGSYGKTSVKFYLQTLLRERFNVLVTPESYNTPMGVVKTIRSSLKPTHEIFVCEMGARYVGDIKEICDIVHPNMGVITSIGPQHLETFGGMEQIQNTKFELADALGTSDKLFLNGDNEWIQEKAKNYPNKIFYYAQKDGEGYKASDVSVSQTGTDFTVTNPAGESEHFQMRLIGSHNVINVVGAIAVANTLGISLSDLRIPVRKLAPVEHRMQIRQNGDVTIIDDAYNSNPVGSKAAVETLALFDGVRILVTPGMVELGEKEEEYNNKFGGYAAKACDYILLVGGGARTNAIKKGALDGGFPEKKCKIFDNLQDALSYAYAIKDDGHKYILLENDLPDNYIA